MTKAGEAIETKAQVSLLLAWMLKPPQLTSQQVLLANLLLRFWQR